MKQLLAGLTLCFLAGAAVPSPEAHFGHRMGADRKLLTWEQVGGYFRVLERESGGRLKWETYGRSTEGRPLMVAVVSSAANMQKLERFKQIQANLSDPRRTSSEMATQLAAEGKTIVLITCAIHSTEVASTYTAIEFAHRLLTSSEAKHRAMLENTVLLLAPNINPDGHDLVAAWYQKTLGTPYEGTAPPQLYQKYTGHDNNRDWYIFSQAETRALIAKLHNVWHPHIVYDVHQQGPAASRMFVPPWMDPVDPNIDPIITQLCNAIGMGIAADLTAAGKTGVAVNAMYDFWHPGRHYQAYHGGLRILSESASARLATPVEIRPEQITGGAQGYHPRESSWNHLEPWTGGRWSLRDIVDYQLIAFESVLHQAAMRRADFQQSFYAVHRRAVERATPYAFVVPSQQADADAARKMLETLAFGMVEIDRARDAFRAGGREYREGSYVIRLKQPYSGWAKTLLERQRYPDLRQYPGGPPKRPYDVTAHTLPLLMGVEVHTLAEPFEAALERASSFPFPPGPSDIGVWKRMNEWWKQGPVYRNPATGAAFASPTAGAERVNRPRIGLYQSFNPAMDEGWTRWLLEEFGFAYQSVQNPEVKAGQLRAKFDVLVFPDQTAASISEGYRAGSMPAEYTGGLGAEGAQALRQFAEAGGTLVFLNHSADYAVEALSLPVKNVVKGLSNREFYSPGSLLNVKVAQHPLTVGAAGDVKIWSEGSPAFELSAGTAVLQYPDSALLASGWLLGEKFIAAKSALAEVSLGRGRVILFGFRPQYRAQSYATFKMLFNAFLR
jgi:hypothetical protein